MPERPADAVDLLFSKYDGRPHWTMWAQPLGEDEHGLWFGSPPDQEVSRPGLTVLLAFPWALLVPRDRGYVASFNARADDDPGAAVYVDMTTVPVWETPTRMTAVDLDLDVVRRTDGTVYVDDEDEFAEHRVTFGYPPDVVELAEESCRWVLGHVRAGTGPFGAVGEAWMDRARLL